MALDPDVRQRWKDRFIGDVPMTSARGIVAMLLLGISLGLALVFPLLQVVSIALGQPQEQTNRLTLELMALNLVFSTMVFFVLPILAIVVSRPGRIGAVADRLFLQVRTMTFVHVLIGIGAAIGSIVVLAIVVFGLIEAGLITEDSAQSELVPEIQAILNWPLVFIISIVAGVTEEVFFRGLLQPRIGIFASSLLFGIIHVTYGTVLQVVAPFVLGLMMGFLLLKTRSLWAPIAAHFSFDFIQLTALLVERQ